MSNPHQFATRLVLSLTALIAVGGSGFYLVHVQKRPVAMAGKESASVASKSSGPALLVEALPVQCRIVQEQNTLSGQVEPFRIATVAAEVARPIVSRPVQQGDRVVAGAILATLETDTAQAVLDQARATAAQTVAARRQAESELARAIVETDAARQQARAGLDQASAAERQARAQVAQANAGRQKAATLTRRQELRQTEAALAQARSDEKLAKIENDRNVLLVKEGAAPRQSLDRTQAALEATTARRQSAEEALSLANEGARQEDIATAAAQVDAADAQVRSAAAQTQSARATVRIADTRDTRLEALRHQIEGLRAQEAQAVAAVHQSEISLGKSRIAAPFTGRVLATLAEAGEMTAPGTPLIRLGAIDRVKVTFSVPESSRPALRKGQAAKITVDALPGRSFPGTLTALGFQADAKARAFPIEITVLNPEERLLPNMVAHLALTIHQPTAHLLVPISAVTTDNGTPCVFVLRGERAIRTAVKLGSPLGDQVEILQGLQSADRIAATPQRLSDGVNVRVQAQGASR
ncbi:MAG: secretion protein HlyD, partial [Chthonomonadales bacterium]|nr:secretion protein HlyD [Chthonomonadales bacterium]